MGTTKCTQATRGWLLLRLGLAESPKSCGRWLLWLLLLLTRLTKGCKDNQYPRFDFKNAPQSLTTSLLLLCRLAEPASRRGLSECTEGRFILLLGALLKRLSERPSGGLLLLLLLLSERSTRA